MDKLEGDHIPGLLMLVGFEKASRQQSFYDPSCHRHGNDINLT
jgi:hypothetical protein